MTTVQEKYKAISGADFDLNQEPAPFSMSVEALESGGKTHFSLMTTPLPIVHVNFGDRDATWFLYQMEDARRKQVTMYNFAAKSPDGWSRSEGMESLVGLSEIAKEHLSNNAMAGGTFVLDSGSSWWEVVQECYVAPEQEKRDASGGKRTGGLEYMQGNLVVSGIISWLKAQGVFVILTHRKRQAWDKNGPIPGKFEAQLNRKVPYMVEVRLDLYTVCTTCGSEACEAKGHQGRLHRGRFLKFAANTGLVGYDWEVPDFPTVYALYTGRNLHASVVENG